MSRTDANRTANGVLDLVLHATSDALKVIGVAGSALLGSVSIDQTTPGTTNRVDIGAALPAGSAVIGKVSVDQTTPGTTDRVTVGGVLASISVAKTRVADTNAYIAKDVIDVSTSAPTGFVFTSVARASGGSGVIVKAQLGTSQIANTARHRLHLFNAAPSYINDNAPFLTLYANIGSYVGSIDFDALATEDPTNSTQAYSQRTGYVLPFVCNADANLYGMLEAVDAYTPANAQTYTIKLLVSRN